MKTKYIFYVSMLLIFMSCSTSSKKNVTSKNEYNTYLEVFKNESFQNALNNIDFWEQKLEANPNQFPYLSKLASTYNTLFSITGKIEYLKEAESKYLELNQITNYRNSNYLKALAANYISQHKFKESLELLKIAESHGDNLEGTQKMLFDVHLELGNYELAKSYLDTFTNENDFDYLIRLSKWSDHRGNLDAAIKYMEKAKDKAEASNVPDIKQWAYTNLADFHGHAGNIEVSYSYYLKALDLDANDAYAKKGIAWIVYSHEKNPDEALRILNTITETHFAPDYFLLKAEIAEFKGDFKMLEQQLKLYELAMQNKAYGDMYNKYNVLLYTNDSNKIGEALALAKTEVKNRPTPQSYDLLAWSYYKKGDKLTALNIVKKHVYGKTSEPEALYHLAEVFKANGDIQVANNLKEELLESAFELGPLMLENIKRI